MALLITVRRRLRRRNLFFTLLITLAFHQFLYNVRTGNLATEGFAMCQYAVAAERLIPGSSPMEDQVPINVDQSLMLPKAKEKLWNPKENELLLQKPAQNSCEALEDEAEYLPDVLFIPFEEATRHEVLQGWEDEWISTGDFHAETWGTLREPKIDVVYTWVNGSDPAFQRNLQPYETESPLNDEDGLWIARHRTNRYRDWDELRYSMRSLAMYTDGFINRIQVLVNSVAYPRKQQPWWLVPTDKSRSTKASRVEVLAQEDFFEKDKKPCLPAFNSLTIENQIFNTPSEVDHIFALSDDMMLLWNHTAADIYSPLFGPVLGFKEDAHNKRNTPSSEDTQRFGEKPFLVYTSWLLNRRFGGRARQGQAHFGHSFSRSIGHEALRSFPRSFAKSAARRFRGEPSRSGEPGFQLYFWYAVYHYVVERHREALLWSYLMKRMDFDNDGFWSWPERKSILADLEHGMRLEGHAQARTPLYSRSKEMHTKAGIRPPQAPTTMLWTSLDGPLSIQGLDCPEFDVDECLAPGFSLRDAGAATSNPLLATSTIWRRVAHDLPGCGDCLLKILLNGAAQGLEPLLPARKSTDRDLVIKTLMRYKYAVVEPNSLFEMISDAEQIDADLAEPLVRAPYGEQLLLSQMCLNDDVTTTEISELERIRLAMRELLESLFPVESPWESDFRTGE